MSANFPSPLSLNGRRYFWRSELEAHKRALAGLPFENQVDAPDVLVPVRQAAVEFGVCVRTISRRIAESRAPASA
jgi:hypothetical protein